MGEKEEVVESRATTATALYSTARLFQSILLVFLMYSDAYTYLHGDIMMYDVSVMSVSASVRFRFKRPF